AAGRGVDLSAHRSQLLTAPLVQWAELILVMDAVQRQTVCDRFGRTARDVLILGDLDPERITSRGIEDPVEQSEEVCRRVYARIERCVAELVKVWWSAPAARRAYAPTRRSGGVSDPRHGVSSPRPSTAPGRHS